MKEQYPTGCKQMFTPWAVMCNSDTFAIFIASLGGYRISYRHHDHCLVIVYFNGTMSIAFTHLTDKQ